jgi:HSP20 family protein
MISKSKKLRIMNYTAEIYHPWRTFNALAQQLAGHRLGVTSATETTGAFWSPAVEVSETEANYQITAEVPQVAQDQVKVTVEQGILTLSGERVAEVRSEKVTQLSSERVYGKFRRSFRLPEDVDHDAVRAVYKEGVITITLPKKPEARVREITVLAS